MSRESLDLTMGSLYKIRRCVSAEDAEAVHKLICELAAFEQQPDAVTQTVEDYKRDAFETENPLFYASLIEYSNDNETEAVGVAVWYFTYSTWKGKSFYLEDCECQ